MKGHLALMLLMTLGGCSLLASPPVEGPWVTWQCDTQVQVSWRYVGQDKAQAEVRLGGSEQVYRLAAEAGADGELFSDGVLAFHKKGEEGLAYWVATNDLIGRSCKAP